jgi:two-component sensor histidine kinase
MASNFGRRLVKRLSLLIFACVASSQAVLAKDLTVAEIDRLHEEAQTLASGAPKKTIEIAAQTMAAAKKLGDEDRYTEGLRLTGAAYVVMNDADKGRILLNQAVERFKKTKNDIGLANAYRGIGRSYLMKNAFDKALYWHQLALDAADRSGDPITKLNAMIGLGSNYLSANDLDRAKLILDRAMQIITTEDAPDVLEAAVLTNWASTAHRRGEYAAALPKIEMADALFLKMETWYGRATNACEWASVLIKLNRLNEVASKAQLCVDSARRYGNEAILSDALEDSAISNNKLGNHEKALADASEAEALAQKNEPKDLLSDAMLQKAIALKALGQFEQSATTYDRLFTLQQEILNDELKKGLEAARTQVDLERERENSRLQQLRANEQRTNTQLVIALLALVLLIAALIFWQWRKERRLKNAISDRNKQIESQRSALEAALDENRVLLNDTNHRTKNSFQVLLSMMNRQLRSGEASKGFEETLGRLKAIAQHHNWLDQYDRGTDMALCDIVKPVIEALETIYGKPNRVDVNVPEVNIGAEQVGTLSLLLNEILANAFKYATPKPSDRINLTASANGDELVLHIADTGPGFSDTDRTIGIGLSIISDLADQLGAEISRSSEERKGTRWEIALSLRDTKQLANAL